MQIRRGNLVLNVNDDGTILVAIVTRRYFVHTDIDELEQMVNEAKHYLNQQGSTILEELENG